MTPPPFIGALDKVTQDIIDLLGTDPVLGLYQFYSSETDIIFNPEDDDTTPSTSMPCISVDLLERSNGLDECTGGYTRSNTAEGRIIFWTEPLGDASIPSLNEVGERVDALLNNGLLPDYISEYRLRKAFKRPYMIPQNNFMVKIADTVIIDCEIEYKTLL